MKRAKKFITFIVMAGLLPSFAISCLALNKKNLKKVVTLHIFSSTNLTGNLDPCG